MRSTVASLVVIGLALAAIAGGYVSGQAGIRPPAVVQLHPHAPARVRAVLHDASDAAVVDAFSDDDVVIERPALASGTWLPQRLAVVVGLAGDSLQIDAAFLRLSLPIAFDVDPHAPEAPSVVRFIQDRGDVVLLHVSGPPSATTLDALRAEFGAFDGVASRTSAGMPEALAGTGLLFFDERGDADAGAFARARVPLVSRDTTVDDRSAPAYVAFMLDRAALRSQRQGRVVALMRPLPNSLRALDEFATTRSVQIVALTPDR